MSCLDRLNFMLQPRRGFKFVTLKKVKDTFAFRGVGFDLAVDESITAVFVGDNKTKSMAHHESKEKIERELIKQGFTTVLFLEGSDDISYFKRFKSTKEAIEYAEESLYDLEGEDFFIYN